MVLTGWAWGECFSPFFVVPGCGRVGELFDGFSVGGAGGWFADNGAFGEGGREGEL
jgi:hypothetical protein